MSRRERVQLLPIWLVPWHSFSSAQCWWRNQDWGKKQLRSSAGKTLIPIGIGSTILRLFPTGCDKSAKKNRNSPIVGPHEGAISSLLAGVWSAITQRFSGGNLAPDSDLLGSQVANKKVNNLFKWGMGGDRKTPEYHNNNFTNIS